MSDKVVVWLLILLMYGCTFTGLWAAFARHYRGKHRRRSVQRDLDSITTTY